MISQETIQQIFSRLDIIEIVGGFVKLKKRGSNYLGLCPFHNEKSPSFTVSPTKEIYKCFGCGKSGNAVGFIMDLEKYSYVEALRWLAEKYNVEIEEREVSPEYRQQQQASDSLYIINKFAAGFFQKALFETEEGQDIGLSYLKQRGFREDIIRKFEIGYNPRERSAFADAALEQKYNEDLLQKAGLITLREGKPADNYRERIIFPVHNQSGKILGFGARLIKSNDRAPKYINTPENEIYVKSNILYGAYFARMAIDKADECLLVEGYTDVVSLHQAGIENVVASGGTSLTPGQLRLVKKYTNNLTILYDGDSAGVKAALRGLDLALEQSLNVKLVLIPDKEDPDSYVNKIGARAFTEFVQAEKKDFVLFKLGMALGEAGQDSVRRSAIVNDMAETIAKINKPEDFTIRQDYIRQVSQLMKIDEAGLNDLVNKQVREKVYKDEKQTGIAFTGDASEIPGSASEVQEITLDLMKKDAMQEEALIRVLLDFGLFHWTEEETVAAYLFSEIEENELDKMM
ncbi:MAG: DNA primase, partial [Ferruginibacter sp.]